MSHAMPPNHVTEMTMDERHVLRDWILKGEGRTAEVETGLKVAGR